MKTLIPTFLLAMFLASAVHGQQEPVAVADEEATVEEVLSIQTEGDWQVTRHEVEIDGQSIAYTATAGTIQLKNEKDEPKASVFFISYTRDGVEDLGKRPVMFCFNGGPGSSSVWLHMGCFGPRRVNMDEVGHAVGPPYTLKDNPLSLLDTTDLVFIDPPYPLIEAVAPKLFARMAERWSDAATAPLVLFELPGEVDLNPAGWTCLRRVGKGKRHPTVAIFSRDPATASH